ncbi:MAG: zf-HC2 domain-containing protein [Rhizomicrobium sp.]
MTCDEALKTQAYLDGELDAAQSLEVEAHLEHCAQCQALAIDHADLKSAMAGATYHRAPAALRAKIGAALDGESKIVPLPVRRKPGFWLGAGSGAGGMAIAASLAFLLLAPANTMVADLGDAHVRSLMGEHLIDVASSDHHTVKPWFAGHADVSPPAEDFKADGFTLVGGRIDYVHGARAAVVVYRHGAHIINLFTWADHNVRLPGAGSRDGYRMIFWKQKDLALAAVSDVDPAELDKFVGLVKKSQSRE